MRSTKKGFTLIELMIVIAIIAIIAAIAIPGLLQSQRASNERNASASLKTVATAEADFRSNDRDGNRVNDYWTYDIAGLFSLIPAGGATTDLTNAIKLIEVSICGAETMTRNTNIAHTSGGTEMAVNSYVIPAPKAGYWYMALLSDSSPTTAVIYVNSTDGGSTSHNTSIFGMAAYPDSMSSGRQVFVINEGNTMFKRAVISNIKGAVANPPNTIMAAGGVSGGGTANPNNWPSDAQVQSFYGRMD